jgi:CRP-like cAMP-binding protein/Fe-S-cluster-containing hydrogenase component 2
VIDTKDALAEQAEREVMACIGCHDCMLACPLTQSRAITIAELNAAVHERTVQNPQVIDFVTACTQCRQCVPACPADLSRADMVLFNKMKIEDAVPDHAMMLQVGDDVTTSHFTLDGLAGKLGEVRLFHGVSSQDLRRLLLKVTLRQLDAGEQLCGEGEYHERLYVVLQGSLEQASSGPTGEHIPILVLAPGAFFGEMAIMADQPEPFSVTAVEVSTVLEIPKAAVARLMRQSAAFGTTMDELYRRRALWTYTRKPSLLGSLPEQAMQELMGHAELLTLKPGEVLLRAGEPPRDVYLVRSGFLRVSRGHGATEQVLVYCREGDLYGAVGVLRREQQSVFTVSASSRTEVVRLPGRVVQQVLARFPQAQQSLLGAATEAEQVARSQAASLPLTPTAAKPGAKMATMVQPLSLDALVDHGVAQGSEVLVVDQNRCTNCQGCIEACGRRHGYSRLQLRGLQLDNLLFPTACRHCEDPRCLLCSVNGIVRLPSGEITIVDDNCIGCGSCAGRCPYGNIRMHSVDKPKRGFLQGIWSMLTGERGNANPQATDSHTPRLAVKCDLCAGHDDYACVTACPVGAAARVDPAEVMAGMVGPLGLQARNR